MPHFSQRNDGMGTPQERWRDRHQSGLVSTMPRNRDWPQEGIHCVSFDDSSMPFFLRSLWSMIKNHCSVARKISGFLQRQQWG